MIGWGDCGDRCDLRVANKKKYTNIYPFSVNDDMLASLKTTRELILADDS